MLEMLKNGSGIHIKKKNRGSFTKWCGGNVTDECIRRGKNSPNPKIRKKATFADNARHFKHKLGGQLIYELIKYIKNGGVVQKLLFGGETNSTNNRGTFTTPYSTIQKKYIEDVYKYIINKGYSPRQASAIMGNIMQESGWNPTIRQRGGDSAYGLFQMHGDQYKAYQKYLANTGKQDSLYSPIDYVLDLINETKDDKGNILAPHLFTKEYNRVINQKQTPEVKAYRDKIYGNRERTNTLYLLPELQTAWNDENVPLDELTRLFTEVIERAGKPEHATRAKYANEYYNYFNPPITLNKKGGKAFVPGVSITDSNPNAYKYVKKHYKMKGQYGTKLNFFQKAGNFLNSDTGKTIVGTIGQLYSGIQNNINNSKLIDELQKWKESYINSTQPEDFSEQIMREEQQMKESNPDYNSSPIAIKFRENQLQQENLRLNKEKRAQEADQYIANFILSRQNNNQSKSNIGDLLTQGLGYIGNYLGKNSNDTSSKLFTNTSGYSPISISGSITAPSADSILQKPNL